MIRLRTLMVSAMMRSVSFVPLPVRQMMMFGWLGAMLRKLLLKVEGENGPRVTEIIAGPCKGFKMVADLRRFRAHYLGMYEPEMTNALVDCLKPGMVSFDVGAHIGYMSLLMARCVTGTGRVYAFEPMPENLKMLEQTMQLNSLTQVEIVPAAVSSQSGDVSLLYGRNTSKNRLLTGEDAGKEKPRLVVQVKSLSLDEFIANKGITNVDFIKMDIEGHEIEAFSGARNLLSTMKPKVICEFHSPELYRQGISMFQALGYKCLDLERDRVSHVLAVPGL